MPVEIAVGPPLLSINHGATFMVTDLGGEVQADTEQGVFADDTRFVSYYAIFANGLPWQRLNSAATAYYAARIYLTNAVVPTEDGDVPAGTLSLVINRTVADGIHEDLDVANHGLVPVRFNLEIALRSDFADLFEVKLRRLVRRGRIVTRWHPWRAELETSYTNRDCIRLASRDAMRCRSAGRDMLSCNRGGGRAVAGDGAGRPRTRDRAAAAGERAPAARAGADRARAEADRARAGAPAERTRSARKGARSAREGAGDSAARGEAAGGAVLEGRAESVPPAAGPQARAGLRAARVAHRSGPRRRGRRRAPAGCVCLVRWGDRHRARRRPVPNRSPARAAARDRLPRARRAVSALRAARPRPRRAPELDGHRSGRVPGGPAGPGVGGMVAHRARRPVRESGDDLADGLRAHHHARRARAGAPPRRPTQRSHVLRAGRGRAAQPRGRAGRDGLEGRRAALVALGVRDPRRHRLRDPARPRLCAGRRDPRAPLRRHRRPGRLGAVPQARAGHAPDLSRAPPAPLSRLARDRAARRRPPSARRPPRPARGARDPGAAGRGSARRAWARRRHRPPRGAHRSPPRRPRHASAEPPPPPASADGAAGALHLPPTLGRRSDQLAGRAGDSARRRDPQSLRRQPDAARRDHSADGRQCPPHLLAAAARSPRATRCAPTQSTSGRRRFPSSRSRSALTRTRRRHALTEDNLISREHPTPLG